LLIFVLAGFAQRTLVGGNGLLGGILAALFFVLHPPTPIFGLRAMLDMPAAFFSTLAMAFALVSGLFILRRLGKPGLTLGLGEAIAVGFAISTKMSALLIWTVALFGAVWHVLRHFKSRQRGLMGASLVHVVFLLGVPVAVFVLSNPFLYNNTLAGIRHLMDLSDIVTGYQANNPEKALLTIPQKLKAFTGLGSCCSALPSVSFGREHDISKHVTGPSRSSVLG
jgi:4-amino-4-deoxy-L-arabinose transferase-like glycosyltransferase